MIHRFAIPVSGHGIDLTIGKRYLIGNFDTECDPELFGNILDDDDRLIFECFTDPVHLDNGKYKIVKHEF